MEQNQPPLIRTFRRGRLALCIVLSSCLVMSSPAAADELDISSGLAMVHGYQLHLNMMTDVGTNEFGSAAHGVGPTATGFSFYERQGFLSGLVISSVLVLVGAGGAASPTPKSVTTKKYTSIGYDQRRGGMVKTTVTETTKEYRTVEESQEMMQGVSDTAEKIGSWQNQSFELQVFKKGLAGIGESDGYKLNMYLSFPVTDGFMLDLGFGWGRVESSTVKDGTRYDIYSRYLGIPLRAVLGIGDIVFYWSWELNLRDVDDLQDLEYTVDDAPVVRTYVANSPMRLEAYMTLFDFLYIGGGVVTPAVKSLEFGARGVVGYRF